MAQSVLGIVLDSSKSKVLLVKRKDAAIWVLPGGGVDPDESPKEAVLREIAEETGIQADIEREACVFTPINKLATTTHIFVCKPISGDLKHCHESIDIGFFDLQNLPAPFFYLHQAWISEALKSRDTIRRELNEVTYRNFFGYALRHPIMTAQFLYTTFTKN